MKRIDNSFKSNALVFIAAIFLLVGVTWFRWTMFKRTHPHAGVIEYIFHD